MLFNNAKTNTNSNFGLNLSTIVVNALTYILSFMFIDNVVNKISDDIIKIILPFIASYCLIFMYNLIISPYRLHQSVNSKKEILETRLNKITHKQDAIDKLSKFLSDGINDIWNSYPKNQNEMTALEKTWKDWQIKVEEVLNNEFTLTDFVHFNSIGDVKPHSRANPFNERHATILCHFYHKMYRLRGIIKDYKITPSKMY